MAGTEVSTDWRVGSPITWRGEMNGTAYEDKGEILAADEPTRLSMTHYSPLMGARGRAGELPHRHLRPLGAR